MAVRTIQQDHPFFSDILQLYLLNLGAIAVRLHFEVQKDAMRVVGWLNQMCVALKDGNVDAAKSLASGIHGTYELPDYPPTLHWQSIGCGDDCLMMVSQDLVDFARWGTTKPNSLSFEVVPSVQHLVEGEIEFPPAPDGYVALDGPMPTLLFEAVIAHMIGGSYERHKDHFNAQHGKDARTWPRELQLYRHLRNGCFHGNVFSIWPNKIDPANAPNWCGYEIPSENAVNGKKVVGDSAFFPITHLLPLFDDMAKYTE